MARRKSNRQQEIQNSLNEIEDLKKDKQPLLSSNLPWLHSHLFDIWFIFLP